MATDFFGINSEFTTEISFISDNPILRSFGRTGNHGAIAETTAQDSQPTLRKQCEIYRVAFSVGILGALCVFGTVGNILNLVILKKFRDLESDSSIRKSTFILLSALAVADILVLLSLLFLKTLPTLFTFTAIFPEYFEIFPYLLVYGWPTNDTAHALSTWITVLVTIHRYIGVRWPHRAAVLCTGSKCYKHLAGLIILVVGFQLPTFLDHYLVRELDSDNRTQLVYAYTRLSEDKMYVLVYKTSLAYIVMYVIPLVLLAVFTVFLIRTLRKATALRTAMSGVSTSTDDITFTLVIIIIICMICQPWEPIRRLVEAFLGHQPGCGHYYFYYEEFPSLSFAVNSASNFLVYSLSGPTFRRILKDTCLSCRKPITSKEVTTTHQDNTHSTTRGGDASGSSFRGQFDNATFLSDVSNTYM